MRATVSVETRIRDDIEDDHFNHPFQIHLTLSGLEGEQPALMLTTHHHQEGGKVDLKEFAATLRSIADATDRLLRTETVEEMTRRLCAEQGVPYTD